MSQLRACVNAHPLASGSRRPEKFSAHLSAPDDYLWRFPLGCFRFGLHRLRNVNRSTDFRTLIRILNCTLPHRRRHPWRRKSTPRRRPSMIRRSEHRLSYLWCLKRSQTSVMGKYDVAYRYSCCYLFCSLLRLAFILAISSCNSITSILFCSSASLSPSGLVFPRGLV